MKILVVNLLRLGDFVMIAPVLSGLTRKYPQAQVDVLTFKSTAHLAPITPMVNRWWTLNRDELQAGLGRADLPMLMSFDLLKETLDEIGAEKYDLVINLTHTVFSGWVTGYIDCKSRLGLSFDNRGQANFHSPWFKYLDQHAEGLSEDIFHYTDLFFEACELKGERDFGLKPTAAGSAEVQNLNLPQQPLIVCQTQTSDSKKVWSETYWRELLISLASQHSQFHIVLLGAPNEAAKIFSLFHSLPADIQSRVSTAYLSLDGALALLQRGQLLITADTSIKHLANATPIQVVELSLGSSDYRRTGIYKRDSLILQAQVPCAPCRHSSECSQTSHLCAEKLKATDVACVVAAFLQNDWKAVAAASRNRSGLQALRTHWTRSGLWLAIDVATLDPLKLTETLLERASWTMLLNQEHKRLLGSFGSIGTLIGEEISELASGALFQPLLARLDFLDSDLAKVQRQALVDKASLKIGPENQIDAKTISVGEIRLRHNQLSFESDKALIKQKLVRTLKNQVKDWI